VLDNRREIRVGMDSLHSCWKPKAKEGIGKLSYESWKSKKYQLPSMVGPTGQLHDSERDTMNGSVA
jgi:hypothetical protein